MRTPAKSSQPSSPLFSLPVKQLWAPWRMAYVGGDEPQPEGCVLCRIGGGDDEADHVIERSALTFSVLNRFPYSSGHLMVVPHRHIPDISALAPEEGGALWAAVARAQRALQAAMHPDGFNLGINQGSAAGASLEHLHLHVVPRWGGDTNFMPVLADVKVLPEHLDATARSLRNLLANGAGTGPIGPT